MELSASTYHHVAFKTLLNLHMRTDSYRARRYQWVWNSHFFL